MAQCEKKKQQVIKMKPLVGALPQIDEKREFLRMSSDYFDGIEEAGGIPIMLPLSEDEESIRRCVEVCDGFLFTGGPDIDPELYGEVPINQSVVVLPPRDHLEMALLKEAEKSGKPILGICRGIQVINVFHGGTLFQDLPTQHPSDTCHAQKPPFDEPAHIVTLTSGSPLQKLLDRDELAVTSRHHQAVRKLGNGLKVMAESEDGLIEAVCLPEYGFLWAVQWHPESTHKTDDASKALFRTFINAIQNNY